MAHYEAHEYFDMLMALGVYHGNAGRAARTYAERWPNRRHPRANVIRDLERQCLETGSMIPALNVNAGRSRQVRNVRLEEEILNIVEDDLTRSTRSIGRQLNVSHTTKWQTLHEDSQHPYHYRTVQILNEDDPEYRVGFCEIILDFSLMDPLWLSFILWTDESIFTSGGFFIQHNSHVWTYHNPHATRPSHFQNRFSINI